MKINDLNKLFYFKEAAELLNYTKAAQKLQASPSGIQQAVRALENSLGHKLFIRKSKGLALTPGGRLLYDRVIKSFKELNMAEKELAAKKPEFVENLKILTTPGLASEWVYKSFPLIKEQYPNLMIEFLTSNFEIALDAGDFDIYIGPAIQAAPEYQSLYLATLNFKLYANRKYIKQYHHPKNLEDLKNHKLIKFSGIIQDFYTETNSAFSDNDGEHIYDYVVDYYLAEYKLVEAGLGIACLSQELVELLEADFIDIFAKMKPVHIKIYLYYRRKITPHLIDTTFNALKSISPFSAKAN
jgi:DNA-binding transcriptional LysR family regulator